MGELTNDQIDAALEHGLAAKLGRVIVELISSCTSSFSPKLAQAFEAATDYPMSAF